MKVSSKGFINRCAVIISQYPMFFPDLDRTTLSFPTSLSPLQYPPQGPLSFAVVGNLAHGHQTYREPPTGSTTPAFTPKPALHHHAHVPSLPATLPRSSLQSSLPSLHAAATSLSVPCVKPCLLLLSSGRDGAVPPLLPSNCPCAWLKRFPRLHTSRALHFTA